MKTNLDSLFKNSEAHEQEGVWFKISEEVGFLIRRFGGYNSAKVKQALAKHYKPYARMVENGTIEQSKEKEIMLKVFCEACMIDWKGVEIDGKIVPFDQETAIKFFLGLPELADTLVSYASDSKNFREDLGNF